MVNAHGGINGRKLRFISHDDSSDPSNALDLTRGLVERDDVRVMFGSFGTPGNLAALSERTEDTAAFHGLRRRSLERSKRVSLDDGLPSFRAEGRIYANYIQAFYPDKKIVALWHNDEFGRDLF